MNGPFSPRILFFAAWLSIALLLNPTAIALAQTASTPPRTTEVITLQAIATYFDQTLPNSGLLNFIERSFGWVSIC